MDNDGNTDLVITKRRSCDGMDEYYEYTEYGIVYNNGEGVFADYNLVEIKTVPSNHNNNSQIMDFNNDGLLDIATISLENKYNIKVFINDGAGAYQNSYTSIDIGTPHMTICDYNGDGYVDIVAIASIYLPVEPPLWDWRPTVSVFTNNGDATFTWQNVTTEDIIEDSFGIVSGDFNGDGFIDVATVREQVYLYDSGIDIFSNDGAGNFTHAQYLYDFFDGLQFLCVDIDNDKSLDFVTTDYKASGTSSTVAIRKGVGIPAAPDLYSPLNGKNLTAPVSPTLDCVDVAGANWYGFVIDDNEDFSSPIAEKHCTGISEWDVPVQLDPGVYYWRARAGNFGCGAGLWSVTWHIVVEEGPILPPPGNYPNPFNPSTTISYSLANSSAVSLTIFDSLGRVVKTLVDQPQAAGDHQVVWNGTNEQGSQVASGVYFYRLKTGEFTHTKRMILLK
jgi:hypothetical protein